MTWGQFRTLFWLRWRLAYNQWTRGSGIHAISAILILALALCAAIGAFSVGAMVGAQSLAQAGAGTLMLVWDGVVGVFLLFWVMGIAIDLQRSEIIDLQRLLHLPVTLRGAFLINYAASHFTTNLILGVPAMLGLVTGLAIGRGPAMALLVFPIGGVIFMLTSWTYALRGWVGGLMTNPRTRRTIIVGISLGIVLLAQAPNIYFNIARSDLLGRSAEPPDPGAPSPPDLLALKLWLPPFWIGLSAAGLAGGSKTPALAGAAAAALLGALGLATGYRATLRAYVGGKSRKPAAPRTAPAISQHPPAAADTLLERSIPGLPDAVAAIALATFRSMTRAPEVKMAIGGSLIMLVIFGTLFVTPGRAGYSAALRPWLCSGAFTAAALGMSQLFLNQFGFDRQAFRSFLLAPIAGREILLGKNLGALPILAGFFLAILTIIALLTRLPASAIAAACCQIGSAFLLLCLAGNLTSILLPYRIAPGTMSPTKMKPGATILLVLSGILLPVLLAPIAIPLALESLNEFLKWLPGLPINLVGSASLLGLLAWLYAFLLGPSGRLFDDRKLRILESVTRHVE